MKVLGINGSGRRSGNTAVFVQGALEGAQAAGAQTELFELASWDLHGCTGCEGCKQTHRCVVRDDMRRFYEIAEEADLLVLGTPIYLDHVTAQMMAFMQRLYCYLGPNLENHYPHKSARAVLGITYGDSNPQAYREVLAWMGGRLKGYFAVPTVGQFAIHSAAIQPNVTSEHPEVRRAAHLLGQVVSSDREPPPEGA